MTDYVVFDKLPLRREINMLAGFKEFIMRGNVIDLAVGVVVGGAFTAIVTALVNDIINPLISLIIGGLDFSGLNIGVFPIGDLIMSIINFLCISFVVFWMVKIINRFNRKKEKEPEPEAPAKPTTDELLADILAELKLQNGRAEAAETLDAAEKEESSASDR